MTNEKWLPLLLASSLLVACGGSSDEGPSGSSSSSSEQSSSEQSSSEQSSSEQSSSEQSSSEQSSSDQSSSESSAIENTPLPITEDFDQVVDQDGFFSTAYRALATLIEGEELPFYAKTGGNLSFADGEATLMAGRFTLGNTTPTTETTADDLLTATTGELDLSEPYKISFCALSSSGAGVLQVYVDNNTTSQSRSVHGNASRLYSVNLADLALPAPVTIQSDVGTSTSFLQLRTDSNAEVVIDDLWVGYQSDTATEPSRETCAPEDDESPTEPLAADFDFEEDEPGSEPVGFSTVGGGVLVSDEAARTGAQSVKMTRVASGVNTQLRRTLERVESGVFKVSILISENATQDVFLTLYDGNNNQASLSIDVVLRPNGDVRNRGNGSLSTIDGISYTPGEWLDVEMHWDDILSSREYTLIFNGEVQGVFPNHQDDRAPDRFEIKYGIQAGDAEPDAGIYVDTITAFGANE